ncbi:MAG: TVP38/TMEM64 family protein [Oleiphilaceae bacterium]|nr:TVP38/TMEM64 family protein [Oleiphilaceae bacterium]
MSTEHPLSPELTLSPSQRLILMAVVVLAILGAWQALRQMGLPDSLSPGAIAVWLGGSGPWGPVLLMLLMVMAVVVGPIPTLPISAASGLAFGLWGGTLVAAAGATLGALVAFALSRVLGREALRRRFSDNPFFASDAAQPLLFWSILVTRLIPLFSFALISYGAGLTAITTGRFLLASFIGMLPMTLVFAGLGQGLAVHPLLSVVAGAGVLLVMMLAPYCLQRHPRVRRWIDDRVRGQEKTEMVDPEKSEEKDR